MILYSIMRLEKRIDWAGTQAEAKQTTKEHQAAWGETYPCDKITWCETLVPVDKPGLLAWLKENALGEKKVKLSAETPHLLTPAIMETNPQIVRQGPHKMWNVLDQE